MVIRHEGGATTVEVAHEALLRKWTLVRGWLDAERDFLVGKVQLRFALETWRTTERKQEALLQGLALTRARQSLHDHKGALSPEERGFIEASIVRDDAERAARRRRQWITWSGALQLSRPTDSLWRPSAGTPSCISGGRDLELVMGEALCNWVGWRLPG
jgi:hypothetical protein